MSASRDWDQTFRDDLAADAVVERRLLVKEMLVVAIIALLVALREWLL
jgi:hypothetical protein